MAGLVESREVRKDTAMGLEMSMPGWMSILWNELGIELVHLRLNHRPQLLQRALGTE